MGYPNWLHEYYQVNIFGKGILKGYNLSPRNTSTVVGQYFEILTSKLVNNARLTDRGEGTNPDITTEDYYIEVKASKKGVLCSIDQIDNYIANYNKPTLYFLYVYSEPKNNPLYMSGDSIQLLKRLSKNLKSVICCDASFLKELSHFMQHYSYGIWRGGGTRNKYIRFSPVWFKYFLDRNILQLVKEISDGEFNLCDKYVVEDFSTRRISLGCTVCSEFKGIVVHDKNKNINSLFNKRVRWITPGVIIK